MGKKGFFFTLLTFIFFFLILISITTWSRIREPREERVVIDIRIKKMNEFSNLVREDAFRMTQIIGFNSLKTATRYVSSNNESLYLNNSGCLAGSCLYELMYNATIAGKTNYTDVKKNNVSFSDSGQMGDLIIRKWDEQMILLADRSNFDAKIFRDNIAVYQSDPWNVKIGYNLYLNVTDRASDLVSRSEVIPVLVTLPITNYTYGG